MHLEKNILRLHEIALMLSLAFCFSIRCQSFAADPDFVPTNGIDYFGPAVLTGTIYVKAADPKKVLFTFRRTATCSGTTIHVQREYTDPAGKIAARERVEYAGSRLVSFELEETGGGAAGTVTIQGGKTNAAGREIEFTYSPDRSSPKKYSREKFQEDTLINDMIGPYLAAHWATLMSGSAVKFRFAVVARKETVGFKFVKESEGTWHGIPVVMVRMEPASWVIARLVDPLHFTVEKEGQHRVLQYVGRTTPRLQHGKKWDDLDAVSVFDWK